jgi:mycothiol maleylpyruvate isomerase-like protein
LSFIDENARELDRLRMLVARLTDSDLTRSVTPEWSVADMLGHVAFWDARASALAAKLERGIPFTDSDYEPEDVDVLNTAAARLVKALPPRDAAELAVRLAEEVDARIAKLPPEQMWPQAERSPLNAFRSSHRREHLDQIEAALRT